MNSSVWAVWAAQGSKEKKWIWVFLSNFWGWFFQLFVGKKKLQIFFKILQAKNGKISPIFHFVLVNEGWIIAILCVNLYKYLVLFNFDFFFKEGSSWKRNICLERHLWISLTSGIQGKEVSFLYLQRTVSK